MAMKIIITSTHPLDEPPWLEIRPARRPDHITVSVLRPDGSGPSVTIPKQSLLDALKAF